MQIFSTTSQFVSKKFFKESGLKPIVSKSTSTKIGLAPIYEIALQVAMKVSG